MRDIKMPVVDSVVPLAVTLTAVPAAANLSTGAGDASTGNNTAAWNPILSSRVPLDSQAGTYTGTVTHSVA